MAHGRQLAEPPAPSSNDAAPLSLVERARRVRLLCLDVDGVLTDAGMYYGPDGEVLKKFNTRDGMGIGLVRDAGLQVALISTESTSMIHARAAKLRIEHVFTGARDKSAALAELCARLGLTPSEVAYVGDDVNDLPALAIAGLPCAVADAVAAVRRIAAYVTLRRGGDGAVREVCDLLLAARAGSQVDDQALRDLARA